MIVAGFGFRAGATADSLRDALARAGRTGEVACLATAADKAETGAFHDLASALRLPVRAVPAAALGAQQTQTQSQASQANRETGSVAEAAALAAAGPGARLFGPRVVSADRMATCALAEGNGS